MRGIRWGRRETKPTWGLAAMALVFAACGGDVAEQRAQRTTAGDGAGGGGSGGAPESGAGGGGGSDVDGAAGAVAGCEELGESACQARIGECVTVYGTPTGVLGEDVFAACAALESFDSCGPPGAVACARTPAGQCLVIAGCIPPPLVASQCGTADCAGPLCSSTSQAFNYAHFGAHAESCGTTDIRTSSAEERAAQVACMVDAAARGVPYTAEVTDRTAPDPDFRQYVTLPFEGEMRTFQHYRYWFGGYPERYEGVLRCRGFDPTTSCPDATCVCSDATEATCSCDYSGAVPAVTCR